MDTLLLTHTHWDHVGAAYYLQQVYRFNILGARRAAQLLPKNKVVGFIDRLNQEYKKMMKDDSDIRFGLLENLEAVHDGDTIRVDDQSYFEVIETPGHTKCSVAYLLHPDKILFQGDAAGVLETDGSIKPLFLSSYKEHENSIKKLIAAGAEILAFPHNRFIKGKEKVEEYLQASLARTQGVKEEIRKLLRQEPDITKIADAVYRREFPKPSLMGPKEALVINLEAMVKAVQKEFPEE
ncbi:MAG: MBL fold metallo-hydrolase [bacterium]|nr:MBL fold metallo-hydrolase [bacterium]